MMASYLTRETRLCRMERALRGCNLGSEWARYRSYRAAGIEAIEPGDDANAIRRAEIYRAHILVLPRADWPLKSTSRA